MKLLLQLIIKFWFILIISVGLGQTTGCMDDGYQQWSPNFGSPACNYAPSAIIDDGSCQYYDCADECGGAATEDECGICDGDGSTCSDCNGVSNGTAYNDACDQCVGGKTGNSDAFYIGIDTSYLYIPSDSANHRIPVNVSNVGLLNSFDMELDYDSTYIQIVDFIDGIELNNYDYELSYSDSIINNTSIKRARFSLFYSPDFFDCSQYDSQQPCDNIGDCFWNVNTINCEGKLNQFSNGCNDENKDVIFQIKLNASEVTDNILTPISIHNLVLNENPLDIIKDWDILVYDPNGCFDEQACNYNPNTPFPDNDVCEYLGEENWPGCDCSGEAYIDTNCGICVGGTTGVDPCIPDCSGVWNGSAYKDFCGNCIEGPEDIDCFMSSFKVYNSHGNIIENDIIPELDTIYVALHMQNLPDSLEGIDVKLGFDTDILSLDTCSINPDALNIAGDLTGELLAASPYALEYGIEFDTTISASIYSTSNELYEGGSANILFLQFSSLGTNGDSTVISYNHVVLNETYVMKEQNYTSQVIYFGDCNGVFNGQALFDDCGVCDGLGAIYECLNGGYVGTGGCYDIADDACDCDGNTPADLYGDDACDCDGNTPADLYGSEDYNCEGVFILSLNESLIPQDFTLSQNYPNPFNPITYINYSVPNYDFITIDIINISGQIIKTIVQSSHQPGNYEIMWDGTNQTGYSVPSGIYFYKLDADEFISVKKLVLLK